MLLGPASICPRGIVGDSYPTSNGPKHSRQAENGPSAWRSPHARQTRWVALPNAPARTPGGVGNEVSSTAVIAIESSLHLSRPALGRVGVGTVSAQTCGRLPGSHRAESLIPS